MDIPSTDKYESTDHSVTSAADLGLLLLRLAVGAVFFIHGSQKVLGWFGGYGFHATIAGMTGMMHIPLALAYLAIAAEFLGGLGLIFGVLSRLSALGIFVNMVVAIVLVHMKHGFFMNWSGKQAKEGIEYHILVLGMCAMIILAGPGRLAIFKKM